MEHPVRDFHAELGCRNAKSPALEKAGLLPPIVKPRLKAYQPRVRDRIMKLSKVYSATCHHRY
jgi:hypothetical protein